MNSYSKEEIDKKLYELQQEIDNQKQVNTMLRRRLKELEAEVFDVKEVYNIAVEEGIEFVSTGTIADRLIVNKTNLNE